MSMTTRRLFRCGALLVALTLCGAAWATEDEGRERKREGRTDRPVPEKLLKKFDKNGDGKLDEQERKAAREAVRREATKRREGASDRPQPPTREQLRKKFDKNRNGKLDGDEITAAKEFVKKWQEKQRERARREGEGDATRRRPGDRRPSREAILKKFDKNGDGKLDEQERKAAREAVAKQRRERAKVRDGEAEKKERPRTRERGRRGDRGKERDKDREKEPEKDGEPKGDKKETL